MRTFGVDGLRIGRHDVGRHFTHDVEHAAVGIHCVLVVLGCIVILPLVGKISFFERHNTLHERILPYLKLDFFVVVIIICHDFLAYLEFCL